MIKGSDVRLGMLVAFDTGPSGPITWSGCNRKKNIGVVSAVLDDVFHVTWFGCKRKDGRRLAACIDDSHKCAFGLLGFCSGLIRKDDETDL